MDTETKEDLWLFLEQHKKIKSKEPAFIPILAKGVKHD